jgi:hypothetical protein
VPVKEAKRVVADAISATRGQFRTTSLLVLAGAFWAGDFDEHAEAAAKALGKRLPQEASEEARAHRQNLCGVILVSTAVQFARTRGTGAFEEEWDEVDWSVNQSFRWVPNPAYAGAIRLTFAHDLSTYDVSVPPSAAFARVRDRRGSDLLA